MTLERWNRIEAMYQSALSLDAGERVSFIDEACGDDEELRHELRSLIRSHERAGDFIEAPALEVAARLYSDDRCALLIGEQIGRYRITSLLGAGGMGEVYRAVDTQLDREVAIKILPPDLALSAESLARFKREAKAVAALSHPNILALHDVGFERDVHFAVMELLEGETLGARLRRGSLEWRQAAEVAIGVANGLAAAHAKETTHGDLKPDNIFLTTAGQTKILDFGLARVRPGPGEAVHHTLPGSRFGTPPYMSPEQLRGEPVGPQGDIFAFGCVLHEMVTGRPLFARPTLAETVAAILTAGRPAMAESTEQVPDALERLVQRCLQPDPAERSYSASDLARALPALLTGAAPEELVSRKPRAWTGWAALTAVAIALTIVAFLAWQSSHSATTESVDSLVILPLTNETGDPGLDYVSDGITETLINDMSRFSDLRVIARTTAFQYKRANLDPQKAARELNVRRVFSGKLIRRGDVLSVQVDLMNAADGQELWGERYNEHTSDLLVLLDSIAKQVSGTLHLKLAADQKKGVASHSTANLDAYRLYLLGRYHWNKRTEEGIRKSTDYFQQAIDKDPLYALAYVGLADSYTVLPSYSNSSPREGDRKARAAAQRALEIDANLAEAEATLAAISGDEWNWIEAERRFTRAIELKPGYATARHWHSITLSSVGRLHDALVEARYAYELDPLSLITNLGLAVVQYMNQDYDQAIEQCKRTLELDPTFVPARLHMALSLIEQFKLEEAAAELNRARAISPEAPRILALLGYVDARRGHRQEALDLRRAITGSPQVNPFDRAVLSFGLGDIDEAFEYLNQAYEEQASVIGTLKVDPFFGPWRSDPRLQRLLRRMNL